MEAIDVPVDASLAGERLNRIHQALRCYEQPLPSLMDDLIPFVRERWAAGRATSPLPQASQRFLEEAGSRLETALQRVGFDQTQAVHGDAHFTNVMMTTEGPLWFDFESVCHGPVEWDAGFLPEKAAATIPADPERLAICSLLVSWNVATWCWLLADIPHKREAGEFHLRRLERELESVLSHR